MKEDKKESVKTIIEMIRRNCRQQELKIKLNNIEERIKGIKDFGK